MGTVALFESGFELVAQVYDAGEVHFVLAVDVRAGAAGLDHVLGDQLAHVRHGNEIAGIRRGSGRARRRRGGCRWSWGRLASLGGTDECVRPYTIPTFDDMMSAGDAAASRCR
jgi:hypothetical protein